MPGEVCVWRYDEYMSGTISGTLHCEGDHSASPDITSIHQIITLNLHHLGGWRRTLGDTHTSLPLPLPLLTLKHREGARGIGRVCSCLHHTTCDHHVSSNSVSVRGGGTRERGMTITKVPVVVHRSSEGGAVLGSDVCPEHYAQHGWKPVPVQVDQGCDRHAHHRICRG